MANPVPSMAAGVFIARTGVSKTVANTNVVHTPPPTGNLPTFYSENRNTGRNK